MPEIPITVALFTPSKLKVSPPVGVATLDTEPTIRWKVSGPIEITYIGFSDPVGGPNDEIEAPQEDPTRPGEWTAFDRNGGVGLFSYTVYARTSEGRIVSSDPQIENEGKSGA